MKTCSKCDTPKPLGEFGKDARHSDGLRSECKTCRAAVNRANYEASKPDRNAKSRAYREQHRDELRKARLKRDAANAEALAESRARFREGNRERLADASRRWYYAGNKDTVLTRNQRWREDHPDRAREVARNASILRRARKSSATFVVSDSELQKILGSPCAISGCGNTDVTIDHLIPLSRGGQHVIGNLQPLCGSHNASKNNKTWMEFRVYLIRRQAA